MQRVLDSMVGTPALVLNGRLDILAANQLGFALFAPVYANPVRPANNARFVFLDPHATEFFRDWDKVANDTVAILRGEAGRHPYDRRLSDLIGELSTRSDQFRGRWAAHDVVIHATGIKLIHHPVVGDLDLPYESFPMTADLSQSLLTYTPEPGSPSHDALSLLASWAASAAGEDDPQDRARDQGSRVGSAARLGTGTEAEPETVHRLSPARSRGCRWVLSDDSHAKCRANDRTNPGSVPLHKGEKPCPKFHPSQCPMVSSMCLGWLLN